MLWDALMRLSRYAMGVCQRIYAVHLFVDIIVYSL